jgi:type II secretory pathway component PulL
MLAPDFAVVEQIRTALAAAGFTAELENSSRSGDGVRARLRIAGEAS